jgi:diacylglycerol kinase (ATP)
MPRSWKRKFADAFGGLFAAVGGTSFTVHFVLAGAVVAAAAILRMDVARWAILLLCIAGVLAAEMLNTALESMAKSITDKENPHIRAALDIAAGAVLTAAIGAAAVGGLVFAHRAGELLGWW